MIPKPFFYSTTVNYCIEHGLTVRSEGRDIAEGERRLGAFKVPPFQRPIVWTLAQQRRFIESIWLNLPLGSYAVNVDDRPGYPCEDWLLDGQQRWTAIINYVSDKFPVFDLRFSDLTLPQQRKFQNHPFPAIQTRNLDAEKCCEVYERLAYGGTVHRRKPNPRNPT